MPSRQELPRRSEHDAIAERLRLVARQIRRRGIRDISIF
jgi:hypothetical protein